MLQPTLALRRELTRVIRRYRPDAVVCGDPTVRFYGTRYLNHPDHRVGADVVLDAVFPSAGTRFIFPELLDEGLEPHHVREVWVHGSERADAFVDIARVLDLKISALREHRSEEHTSELQSQSNLVCRLLLEKKKKSEQHDGA